MITVRVYGIPVPQARAGRRIIHTAKGGVFVQSYDRPECVDWKRTVQAQVLTVKPAIPITGALALTLRFELPRPKSLPKRVLYPVKKPDAKNLAWGVEDALRGLLYADDSQIVDLYATKRYGPAPGVTIELALLEAPVPLGRGGRVPGLVQTLELS
jgi:Holliday junction resolvase RusA-like endonuclease